AILRTERTALNLIGRMSGIASATQSLVNRVASINPRCRVAATRKTAPGLRHFDKKAVLLGGGDPHRGTLSDMILIKDNHLALVPLPEAISRARRDSLSRRVEVEVNSPEMALQAARCGADVIMLDNMTPASIRDTISQLEHAGLRDGMTIEVSGKITEDSIAQYAIPGVDMISIGALTHSVKNFDVTLDIAPQD
ncbi:MAG: carboxylating nicotinate-nucleotide diphosphorylase, partial [Methanomicrobiales archaeon]|nr:carboxylating nicotinate-nucleotide diphosphorylase [Methanomicrobiales archaeon]